MHRIAYTAIALLAVPLAAAAQGWNVPRKAALPSKWGAGDERGSATT